MALAGFPRRLLVVIVSEALHLGARIFYPHDDTIREFFHLDSMPNSRTLSLL